MKTLIKSGILDLGGKGDNFVEIKYNNEHGEFKEAFYKIPSDCDNVDSAIKIHTSTHTTLILRFADETHFISLPDKCDNLVAVRLPEAIGGDDITERFMTN